MYTIAWNISYNQFVENLSTLLLLKKYQYCMFMEHAFTYSLYNK